MGAPNIPVRLPLPVSGEIVSTYPELLKQLECLCAGGAAINPFTLPSATINLGDIIADQARILATFTSVYSLVTVVLRMIACIIDVICALVNPFSLIFAIIRLFGTCLPDFLLIFPQFAIPAKIICVIKIILAIIDYILNVILPIIIEIIANIENLVQAFKFNNRDAQLAIAFKIVALFKEILNIIGILSGLLPLWEMIKALLNMGIAIPCGGGGGSCANCGDDDNCPPAIQETSHTGSDGQMIVIYGSEIFDFQMYFYSFSKLSEFLSIQDFFPRGVDYGEFKDEDDLPYTLDVDGNTYAVTSIDSGGYLKLYQILPELSSDGYLSTTTESGGSLPSLTDDIRLFTPTGTFTSLMINKYVTISDTNSSNTKNNGTWKIFTVYSLHEAVLRRDDGESWAASSNVYWRVAPSAPNSGINKTFSFNINHTELIRHNLINLGCHPAVKAEKDALAARLPNAAYSANGLGLPELPDLEGLINQVTSCVSSVIPLDIDSQYVLDNYGTIANDIVGMGSCIDSSLNAFKNTLISYGSQLYPRIFDTEATAATFTAAPLFQVVGRPVIANLIAYDIYGEVLGKGFPVDVVQAEITTTAGVISNTTAILDSYGAPTGEYTATLTSDFPLIATLKAKIANTDVSVFDGYNLVPKEIRVEFVTSSEMYKRGRGVAEKPEPLGSVRSE